VSKNKEEEKKQTQTIRVLVKVFKKPEEGKPKEEKT